MISRLLIPVLLAQAGIHLPLAGYLRTAEGWYELYGVRGNFLTGEKLPDEVITAAAFGQVRAWKTATELIVQSNGQTHRQLVPEGPAWFAWNDESLFAWLPESRQLHRWTSGGWQSAGSLHVDGPTLGFAVNQERIAVLSPAAERRFRLDATWIEDQPHHAAPLATLDANGNRWHASPDELRCGATTWTFTDSVSELSAQGDGWMVVSHGDRRSILRCDSSEETLLPTP